MDNSFLPPQTSPRLCLYLRLSSAATRSRSHLSSYYRHRRADTPPQLPSPPLRPTGLDPGVSTHQPSRKPHLRSEDQQRMGQAAKYNKSTITRSLPTCANDTWCSRPGQLRWEARPDESTGPASHQCCPQVCYPSSSQGSARTLVVDLTSLDQ